MANVYVKKNVSYHEYMMHSYVYNLKIVNMPEIISYDSATMVLTMVKINNMNISDMYGEDASNVESYLFDKIRDIIKILKDNNISYPDITGYNFIEYEDKVHIIDFEHSRIIDSSNNMCTLCPTHHIVPKIDRFITKFINGYNEWNPEYL